jgi:hypothetical protein
MLNEEMIKLAEVMASAGFRTLKIDFFCYPEIPESRYRHIELFLSLSPRSYEPLPKEKFIQLVEILGSVGLGIADYNSLFRDGCIYFKLVLYYLPKKSNVEEK